MAKTAVKSPLPTSNSEDFVASVLVPVDVVQHIEGTLSQFRPVSKDLAHAMRYLEKRGEDKEARKQLYESKQAAIEHKRALRLHRLHETLKRTTDRKHDRSSSVQQKSDDQTTKSMERRALLESTSQLKMHKATGTKLCQLGRVRVIARTKQVMAMQRVLHQRSVLEQGGHLTLSALIDHELGTSSTAAVRELIQQRAQSEAALRAQIQRHQDREAELRATGFVAIQKTKFKSPPRAKTAVSSPSSNCATPQVMGTALVPSVLPIPSLPDPTDDPILRPATVSHALHRGVTPPPPEKYSPSALRAYLPPNTLSKHRRDNPLPPIEAFNKLSRMHSDVGGAARKWLQAQLHQIHSRSVPPTASDRHGESPQHPRQTETETALEQFHNVELNDDDFVTDKENRSALIITQFMRVAAAKSNATRRRSQSDSLHDELEHYEKELFSLLNSSPR